MQGFDKTRFAETLLASFLGSAINDRFQTGAIGGTEIEVSRKFQRALLLALSHPSFDEVTSQRYATRVAALHPHQRRRYMLMALQPTEDDFDEKLSSLFVFDHALKTDVEWNLFMKMFALDQPHIVSSVMEKGIGLLSTPGQSLVEYIHKKAEERRIEEERLSKTWFGRLRLRFRRIFF